jgi:hypothetical protein
MKNSVKASIAAVLLAMAATSQAATINDTGLSGTGGSDVVVNILNDAGDSLIVNTHLNAADFVSGTVTSWTSDAGLTASISSFLAGSVNAQFWAVGAYKSGFFDESVFTTSDSPWTATGLVDQVVTAVDGYIANANFGAFGADAAGDGPDVENVGKDASMGFTSPNISPWVNPVGLDTPFTWKQASISFFTGITSAELLSWTLASDGTLSYGAATSTVPVPAAAWLFGSGLVGLVGVARRRRSA